MYNIYGEALKQPREQLMNPQALQMQIASNKMKMTQDSARKLVRKYNERPKSLSGEEVVRAMEAAQMYGWNVSRGRKKDKTGVDDALFGLIGGAVDGALLGLVPDKWYSNRRNKGWGKAGRLGGVAASLAIPGAGFLQGAKASTKLGKAGLWAARNMTTAGMGAQAKRMIGAGTLAARSAMAGQQGAAGSVKRVAQLRRLAKGAGGFKPAWQQAAFAGMKDAPIGSGLMNLNGLGVKGLETTKAMEKIAQAKALLMKYGAGAGVAGAGIYALGHQGKDNSYDPYEEMMATQMPQMPQMPGM